MTINEIKKLDTDTVRAMGLRIGGVDILCQKIENKREDYFTLK